MPNAALDFATGKWQQYGRQRMSPWVAVWVSYRALCKHRIRSLLTTLGIIIGVAAVITMVSLTQGARSTIEAQLVSLGGNALVVTSGTRTRSGIDSPDSAMPLTAQDADAMRTLSLVTSVAPIANTAERVIWGNRNWWTAIVGTAPDFLAINDWLPEHGTFFIQDDVTHAEQVCVLGKTVAAQVFGSHNPLGETVHIRHTACRVIGVLRPKGQTASGKDQDDVVLMPYTTLQKRLLGGNRVDNIAVAVRSPQEIPVAQALITQLLRDRHQLRPEAPENFSIKTQLDITRHIFTILRVMTLLLGGIASISLLVGGIGIMNIMLVAVSERTQEIGLRLSVGAKEQDILLQMLIEAVMLSLVGGLLGIGLGMVGAKIAALVTQLPTVVSGSAILLACGVAAMVGIFFGWYPARKATKLNPIEALRYQ
jgi:putative ABC transport system permease protein